MRPCGPSSTVFDSRCGKPEVGAPAHDRDALTAREVEIMELIARGRANRAIAGELFISEKTVKNHIRHIYEKLGAANRSEATAHWLGIADRAPGA